MPSHLGGIHGGFTLHRLGKPRGGSPEVTGRPMSHMYPPPQPGRLKKLNPARWPLLPAAPSSDDPMCQFRWSLTWEAVCTSHDPALALTASFAQCCIPWGSHRGLGDTRQGDSDSTFGWRLSKVWKELWDHAHCCEGLKSYINSWKESNMDASF